MKYINQIYKKGNLVGTLKITQREGAGYKWVNCLALLNDDGSWLSSAHWRTNHFRKAHKDLLKQGFELEGQE